MSWIDLIGFSASLAVLATFCMGTMVSLRAVATLSNALFIAYGIGQHLYPVLLLHAVLLPINVLKIVQLRRQIRQVFPGGAHLLRQAASKITIMEHVRWIGSGALRMQRLLQIINVDDGRFAKRSSAANAGSVNRNSSRISRGSQFIERSVNRITPDRRRACHSSPSSLNWEDLMSITVNAAQRTSATSDAPREQPHTWTTILILLTILACMIAASFHVAAPVLDGSLIGP